MSHTPVDVHPAAAFFTSDLSEADPEVHAAIAAEEARQREQLELMAPKNYLSRAARQALGSIVALTCVEGYPGGRSHVGMASMDAIERLATARARRLFGCAYANVQPHSGTQANQAAFFALLEPGDTVLSMAVTAGGHRSHGGRHHLTGEWFRAVHYGVRESDGLLDYDALEAMCSEERPKLIVAGGSAYPRALDFARLRRIADDVGARLLADVAHFSGLIAAGAYPNPFPHAHIVTTTTNKSLRGPHGGLVLCDEEALGKRLDSAVFPGLQGGPIPELIAAKAVCFGEALTPQFRRYAHSVLDSARTLCGVLQARGYDIVTGGTDTPFLLVDLRPKCLTGEIASASLEAAGLPCSKTFLPCDAETTSAASGLRIGTSAIAARGMGASSVETVGHLIADVLDALGAHPDDNRAAEGAARAVVRELVAAFPIYPEM